VAALDEVPPARGIRSGVWDPWRRARPRTSPMGYRLKKIKWSVGPTVPNSGNAIGAPTGRE